MPYTRETVPLGVLPIRLLYTPCTFVMGLVHFIFAAIFKGKLSMFLFAPKKGGLGLLACQCMRGGPPESSATAPNSGARLGINGTPKKVGSGSRHASACAADPPSLSDCPKTIGTDLASYPTGN